MLQIMGLEPCFKCYDLILFALSSLAFFFVLCSDILFYGEELSSGLLKQGQTKRYKFHREFFLDELMVILNPNESKSFIVRGLDKGSSMTSATYTCDMCPQHSKSKRHRLNSAPIGSTTSSD